MSLLLFAGCDHKVCTLELRSAISVRVEANGLPVDSVTARLRTEAPCQQLEAPPDAGSLNAPYTCWEQGGGTYVVKVTSGSLTWTDSVFIREDEDGCHVKDGASLTFELDPDTAD